MKHEVFNEGSYETMESDYPWVLSPEERGKIGSETKQRETAEETLNKLYQIYVSRSSSLFLPDSILFWLKDVIGFILNSLDDGTIDRDIMIAKFTSLTPAPFCYLARYRQLRQADFTDDITTINPNELLMGGEQEQEAAHHQQENLAAQ